MPIGVPRIIYCWGEELPAQWTDIYNFIFRRRMVFLMQYLDDELCNQICGLLINIHMEDRSKELEKKEMDTNYSFGQSNAKGGAGKKSDAGSQSPSAELSSWGKRDKSSYPKGVSSLKRNPPGVEDLLKSEDDLAIDQNNVLEQYTLQKITMEWLNWNAQFFDYSDEPYLYYLADILSKDFANDSGNSMYNTADNAQNLVKFSKKNQVGTGNTVNQKFLKLFQNDPRGASNNRAKANNSNGLADVYSPFRSLANFAANNYDVSNVWPMAKNMGNAGSNQTQILFDQFTKASGGSSAGMGKLLNDLAQQKLSKQFFDSNNIQNSSENALGQRSLKREYLQDRVCFSKSQSSFDRSFKGGLSGLPGGNLNYLDTNAYGPGQSLEDYSQFYRKQTERTIQEEESKKVFVIINSFGGSVGNGITVHDALQFIKAGSLTLGLGVAASAASLVLAGGTIGERYVTEGCHVMIHQPEGGLNGQASDIWIDANEIMKIRLDVAEIYSLSTYRPRHKILRDLDRDFYLTATETIQYGLADEIATNEVMHSIIEMTSKVWDFHDAQQQRLLETRESATAGLDTQTQN